MTARHWPITSRISAGDWRGRGPLGSQASITFARAGIFERKPASWAIW
ncbi:MAG: hypothetical protein ACOY5Y_06995 [Pseudomonadota bacterium]